MFVCGPLRTTERDIEIAGDESVYSCVDRHLAKVSWYLAVTCIISKKYIEFFDDFPLGLLHFLCYVMRNIISIITKKNILSSLPKKLVSTI